jgi:hypothetical protein
MHNHHPTMPSYRPSTPRVAFALTAAAISAVLLSIFVVLPASIDAGAHEPAMVAMSMRCAAGM